MHSYINVMHAVGSVGLSRELFVILGGASATPASLAWVSLVTFDPPRPLQVSETILGFGRRTGIFSQSLVGLDSTRWVRLCRSGVGLSRFVL